MDEYLKFPVCNGEFNFPAKYSSKKLLKDKRAIEFLSTIFRSNQDLTQVTKATSTYLKKIGGIKVKDATSGAFTIKKIVVDGIYIKMEVELEFLDEIPVRNKVVLTSKTSGQCTSNNYSFFDFGLMQKHLLDDVNVLLTPNFDEMFADTVYLANLELLSKNSSRYQLSLPQPGNEPWINELLLSQYSLDKTCCYSQDTSTYQFSRLVKEKNIQLLGSLLFSPNYLISVNSFEALSVLQAQGEFRFSPDDLRRIAALKSDTTLFTTNVSSDIVARTKGYGELDMPLEKILLKFKRGIKKDDSIPSNSADALR